MSKFRRVNALVTCEAYDCIIREKTQIENESPGKCAIGRALTALAIRGSRPEPPPAEPVSSVEPIQPTKGLKRGKPPKATGNGNKLSKNEAA